MTLSSEIDELSNLILKKVSSIEIENISEGTKENIWVYQNNFLMGHIKHLKNVFPVCCEILGDGNFNFFSSQYLDEQPPLSENLNNYGYTFRVFLENREELRDIKYICYLAKLEWAVFSQDCEEIDLPLGVYSLWDAVTKKENYQEIVIDENENEKIKFE